MRNNWFMAIGAGRLPLAGRGFLATLEALGDSVTMRGLELDALFGVGWREIARDLATHGYIELAYDEPFYAMKIHYPNERRRKYRREWEARKRGERHAK